MKILSYTKTPYFEQLTLRKSFLWISYNVIYRKNNGIIFRYKHPDRYISTGLLESITIGEYFKFKETR